MNVWGKVFIWLAVLLGGVAMVFTVQTAGVRNSWIQKVDKQNATIQKNAADIAQRQKEISDLRAEYDRIVFGWGKAFAGVTAQVDPAGRGIALNVGRPDLNDKDLEGKPVNVLVHAFQPAANGEFEYVGEFKVMRLDQGQTSFEPNWRVRPGEAANWKGGPNWHIRTAIPPADKARFTDLEVQFVIGDELLRAREDDINRQTELAEFAQKHLDLRIGEIQGFPNLKGQEDKLPAEIIDGIQASLVQEEEARNAALEAGDQLRRELRETNLEFRHLVEENGRLANGLKQTSPAPVQKVSQR
jgi:hypothetical protein